MKLNKHNINMNNKTDNNNSNKIILYLQWNKSQIIFKILYQIKINQTNI